MNLKCATQNQSNSCACKRNFKHKYINSLTMVEPAVFKTIQRVQQRHVKETNHLSNCINGKETDNHSLKKTAKEEKL